MNPPLPNATPEEGHPEKYIRTFEGDMETFKQGGAPDLAPLPESPAAAVPAAAIPPQELPPLQSQTSQHEPRPAAGTTQPPEPPGPTTLETYAGDFSDRIRDTHASAMTVLAAEQDSARGVPRIEPQEEPQSRSTIPYIVIGVVLLITGAAGAYIASMYYKATMAPVVSAPTVPAPIFVDDREQISGSGAALVQAIMKSVNRSITSGGVRLLYTASSTDTGSVFSALGVSAPNVLLRNINAAGSMAGVVNIGGVQSPFFILSVLSYSDTFSGMLSWEPMMRRNLITLFPPYPVASTPAPLSTGSSTPGLPQGSSTTLALPAIPVSPLSSATTFTDDTVANHDVRVYRDSQGRSIMLYGYWNQATLIIARDPASFTEIVQRLATSRAQ